MSKSLEDLIEEFHDKHDVVYELRVLVDDEVLVKETSGISADDVSRFAWRLDEYVEKHIIQEEEDRIEYVKEAAAEDAMEREREERE